MIRELDTEIDELEHVCYFLMTSTKPQAEDFLHNARHRLFVLKARRSARLMSDTGMKNYWAALLLPLHYAFFSPELLRACI